MPQQHGRALLAKPRWRYRNMEQWLEIRKRVLRDGVSKRQILRETGMHWTTLEKILQHSSPPGYQRSQSPGKPKIGPYLERIRQILEDDRYARKPSRLWQGSYTTSVSRAAAHTSE